MRTEMRITGFGGQGIILAGYIVGKGASVYDDRFATMIQAYGPEARGSACSSQIIVSDKPIQYPYLQDQHILCALSQEGYDKFAPAMNEDGTLLYDSDLVEFETPPKSKVLKGVPATRIAEELGRVMVANIVMLGFFTAQTGVVGKEAMLKAVVSSVPKGTGELNTNAFERGFAHEAADVAAGV